MSFRIVPPEMRVTIDKDPDASKRYGVDVAQLLDAGDSVVSAELVDSSEGLAINMPAVSGTVVSARVSGGTVGQLSYMTLRWRTVQGDVDDQTLWFNVVQR